MLPGAGRSAIDFAQPQLVPLTGWVLRVVPGPALTKRREFFRCHNFFAQKRIGGLIDLDQTPAIGRSLNELPSSGILSMSGQLFSRKGLQ